MPASTSPGSLLGTAPRRLAWALLAVAIAAAVPYANALFCGFVYDDHGVIGGAPLIHSLKSAGKLLTADTWLGALAQPSGLYRPLTSLSFAIDWAIWGPNPAPFHAMNVVLHVVVSLLLLIALRRFGTGDPAALAAAILFAVHPLHTEAVTWIVGRAELLGAMFFLAAWAHHLSRDDAHLLTGLRVGFLYLLAMSGKESSAVLLLVLLISDGLRRSAGTARASAERDAGWWAKRYGPVLACLLIFVVARWHAVGLWVPPDISMAVNPLAELGALERLAGALFVLGKYFVLMLWPATLSVDYSYGSFEVPASLGDARALVPATAMIVMVAVAFGFRRRAPSLSLALLFPLVSFTLTGNLLFPIGTIMGERLAYLPSVGVCILGGWAFGTAWGLKSRKRTWPRRVAVAALILLVLAGTWRTLARNAYWVDDETLLKETVRTFPDTFYTRYRMADHYLRNGDEERALAALRECLRIKPSTPEIHNQIGEILRRLGHLSAAADEFQREMLVNPQSTRAPFNLGLVHLAQDRLDLARQAFELAAENDPRNADAQFNLGFLLSNEGDLARARLHLEAALAERPDDPRILSNLGSVAARTGEWEEASRYLEKAVAMNPGDALILYNLGVVKMELGSFAEARTMFDRALQLDEEMWEAWVNLGKACHEIGDAECENRATRGASEAAGRR